jgi:hypothetical protein
LFILFFGFFVFLFGEFKFLSRVSRNLFNLFSLSTLFDLPVEVVGFLSDRVGQFECHKVRQKWVRDEQAQRKRKIQQIGVVRRIGGDDGLGRWRRSGFGD